MRSTARTPTGETELGFSTVLSEHFAAVLPSARPLATQRAVRLAQLADLPFVLLPRRVGPTLHDQVIGLCECLIGTRAGGPFSHLAGVILAGQERARRWAFRRVRVGSVCLTYCGFA